MKPDPKVTLMQEQPYGLSNILMCISVAAGSDDAPHIDVIEDAVFRTSLMLSETADLLQEALK